MTDLETLIATALIGTERQPLPELSLAPGLNGETKEANLLSAAAILTAYRKAGYSPSKGSATLEVSPPDNKPELTNAMREIHFRIVHGHQELLEECLSLFAGYRIAHRDLPMMLDLGRNNTEQRTKISELIDARGRWLANLNKQWSWATSNIESIEDAVQSFETGSKAARTLALQSIRHSDPERARTLLESTWKQEAANERKEFISVLADQLSIRDEPFLEQALSDRSSDVRYLAANLLSSLPESQFNARTRERLRPILTVKKEKLTVELPDAFDPAWAKDGIEEKAPQSIGQKQYWVRQIMNRASLTMLEEITGMDAVGLLKNTHKDWKDFIESAVRNALSSNPTPELVKQILSQDINLVHSERAFKVLEPNFLETLVRQRTFTENKTDTDLLNACEHTWSEPFWIAALEWIAEQMNGIFTARIKNKYVNFADSIIRSTPLELIPRAINGHDSIPHWTAMLIQQHETPSKIGQYTWYWDNTKQQFQHTINTLQLRLEMHTVLKQTPIKETP
jgi:Family of unknown function (DUF5691)